LNTKVSQGNVSMQLKHGRIYNITLLQICCWVRWWKIYQNLAILGKRVEPCFSFYSYGISDRVRICAQRMLILAKFTSDFIQHYVWPGKQLMMSLPLSLSVLGVGIWYRRQRQVWLILLVDEMQCVLWYPLTRHAIAEHLRDVSYFGTIQINNTFIFTYWVNESIVQC